jgi:hypothetical protein
MRNSSRSERSLLCSELIKLLMGLDLVSYGS